MLVSIPTKIERKLCALALRDWRAEVAAKQNPTHLTEYRSTAAFFVFSGYWKAIRDFLPSETCGMMVMTQDSCLNHWKTKRTSPA